MTRAARALLVAAAGLALSLPPLHAQDEAQPPAAEVPANEVPASEVPAEDRPEFSFGGVSTTALEYQVAAPIIAAGRSSLKPMLALRSPFFDLTVTVTVTVDSVENVSIAWDEARALARIGDAALLSGGVFTYLPGTALFFSNVEYFSSIDVSRILTQGLGATGSPDGMVQLKLFGDSWHLTATASPFRPSEELFPTGSPWFPRRDIRESFDVLSTTYTLRNLAWDETSVSTSPVQDPGLSFEAGFFTGPLDLSLSWFDGPDRAPAVTGFITMPVTPWGVYDITLSQVHSRIRREGAAGSLQVGPWKAWVDTSLFQGKVLASGDLYSAADGWQTGTASRDGLDLTLGMSWSFPWASAMLAVEWKDAWFFADTTGLTLPLLDRAIAALATASILDDKVNGSLAAVLSLADLSFALISGATVDLGGETSLSVACPWFFGDPSTELGQFGRVGRGILTLAIRF